MRQRLVLLALATAVAIVLTHRAQAAEETLIAAGSLWKYNDTGANLGSSWIAPGFSDTAWPSGNAQLGYGDGDEVTPISFGPNSSNRYITSYFRRTFTVTNPASIAAVNLRVMRDDGCVVYVNGVEVWRSNLPTGTISYTTRATTAIGGADESAWHQVPVDPARLVAGANLIAVEVHQQAPTSSDVSFDLDLRATTNSPPPAMTVDLTNPADNGIANGASVTFSADVTATAGLASATLQIGGTPQTVSFSGPTQIEDAQITAESPGVNDGSAPSINVDGQTPHAHALMRFSSLLGGGAGQVPSGSIIVSATLSLNCTNPGLAMNLYRLTEDWIEDQATWNQRTNGVAWSAVGADGAASHAGVAVVGDCTATGQRLVDLTRFVQEWTDGSPNYGFVMTDSGTDGIDFSSSESSSSPALTVIYKAQLAPLETQAVSGTSATVTFPVTLPTGSTFTWNIEVTDATGLRQRAPADFTLTVDAAAPDEPVLVSPANGATGVDPSSPLVARVSSPEGGSMSATASIRVASGEPFTIVVLPDTQHYSEAYPAVFTAQTQWIVAQKAARNIVFVTHEGDIVQNASVVNEWDRANASMSLLDGVVPYGMAPGNHDQPSTLYNQYFPFTRYQAQPWYGGHYQSLNDNNFQLFSGGGIDFIAVHLEFCPPTGAVAWAKSMLDQHPNRIGMMTTHGYLNETAQRTVHGCTNTQYLWDSFGAITPNLHFMLSGHVHDESRREDLGNGHTVFQMLADYQDRASGGEGWLRIMRFVPAEDRVYVQTYSPWLNRYESDANSEFTLDFPMSAPWATSAPAVVPSGSDAAFAVSGLQASTKYEWRVTATNGAGKSRSGPLWTFTTAAVGPVNQAPYATDGAMTLAEDSSMGITVLAGDPDGQPVTYTLVSAPTHGALAGTLPFVTYTPAANYNGPDAFTFRVSDGDLTSAVATIAITVDAVNDSPTAVGESYTVPAGGVFSAPAPGVLANDADAEGPLSAALVTGPANGQLTLNANGSFTYTPNTGFIGSDAFTYRATDGSLSSSNVVVTFSVVGVPPGPLFSAAFTSNAEGFTYLDNTFRGTTQSSYASGSHVTTGGYSGGALRVYVGGVNDLTINNMSGGWRRTFSLSASAAITLTFRYRLDQGPDYESDEHSQVLASLNGVLVGGGAGGYISQLIGNGNGGASINTGWQTVTIDLGTLAAGTHTLTLGGFNNRKTTTSERTTILLDDVSVIVR